MAVTFVNERTARLDRRAGAQDEGQTHLQSSQLKYAFMIPNFLSHRPHLPVSGPAPEPGPASSRPPASQLARLPCAAALCTCASDGG